jgi:hypothetical protein
MRLVAAAVAAGLSAAIVSWWQRVLRAGAEQRTQQRQFSPTHLTEENARSDERNDGVAASALSRVAASADLLVEIFLHLSLFEVINAFQVSKAFHAVESREEIWKALTARQRREYRRIVGASVLDELLSWKARCRLGQVFRGHDGDLDDGSDFAINAEYDFFVDALAIPPGRAPNEYNRLPLGRFVVASTLADWENSEGSTQLCLTDDGLSPKPYMRDERLVADINRAREYRMLYRPTWSEFVVYVRRKADGAVAELMSISGDGPRRALRLCPGTESHDSLPWKEYVSTHGRPAAGDIVPVCTVHADVAWARTDAMDDQGIYIRGIGAEVLFAMPDDVHNREGEVDRIRSTHIKLNYLPMDAREHGEEPLDPFPPDYLYQYHALKSRAIPIEKLTILGRAQVKKFSQIKRPITISVIISHWGGGASTRAPLCGVWLGVG